MYFFENTINMYVFEQTLHNKISAQKYGVMQSFRRWFSTRKSRRICNFYLPDSPPSPNTHIFLRIFVWDRGSWELDGVKKALGSIWHINMTASFSQAASSATKSEFWKKVFMFLDHFWFFVTIWPMSSHGRAKHNPYPMYDIKPHIRIPFRLFVLRRWYLETTIQ